MAVSTSPVPAAFQQELAATARHFASVLPPAAAQAVDGGIAAVAASGLANFKHRAGPAEILAALAPYTAPQAA